jgi:hypothetical protein
MSSRRNHMRVIVPDSLFGSLSSTAELWAVLLICTEGVHLLETQPLPTFDLNSNKLRAPQQFDRWLRTQAEDVKRVSQFALEIGTRMSASHSPKYDILLQNTNDDWSQRPLRLTVRTAKRLLELPLQIMLEHGVNDGHFLRSMIPREFMDEFQEVEKSHRLQFVTGGGLASAKTMVESKENDPFARFRTFCLFDSDCREPNNPSSGSERLREACELLGIPHHQLRRRCIENYLPMRALKQWAYLNLPPDPPSPFSRIQKLNALQRLPSHVRYYYNYKSGRRGDRRGRGEAKPRLNKDWRSLSLQDRQALRDGLHPRISKLFNPDIMPLKAAWVEEEDTEKEMFEIATIILESL